MWREQDPRESERDRADLSRGSRGGFVADEQPAATDPRDVFARDLDLPRGTARERVRARGCSYELCGSEVRTLARVGAFRAVPAVDLRDRIPIKRDRELNRLQGLGLMRSVPYVVGRTRTQVVTVTDRGRAVLESGR